MAVTITHPFVSAKPDGADASLVQPSNWNADHSLTGTLPVANGGTGGATASDARTNLGLGTLATQDANNVAITGGSVSGVTITSLDANTTFQDNADPTKQMQFQLSGITGGQTSVLTVPDADGTLALTSNKLSAFAATTSAELASVISDETGSGSLVFATSPTLTTPNIGAATGSSLNLGTGALTCGAITASGNAALGDAEATDTHAIKGATTILSNSASAALTVTNTGSGNSFVVEDNTSPDSTAFVVDSAGNVGTGVAPENKFEISEPSGNTIARIRSAAGISFFDLSRASNTVASPTIVANADVLGRMRFRGYDGTQFLNAASIEANVDGSPSTNDMPGRLVFSTTADGASSPTERMRIDSNGAIGVGGSGSNSFTLNLTRTPTATTSWTTYADPTISATVTTYNGFESRPSTIASSFTVGTLQHYVARQGTIGATSAVTSQFGYAAHSSLTGATNNYGFYSDIASGSNRYNFYAAGTADNYFAGSVGIGGVPAAARTLTLSKLVTGATTGYGILNQGELQSDVTAQGIYNRSFISTQAAAFTCANVYGFQTSQGTIGASSAITNQFGFASASTLTGATNNYGFYSDIASGANRWNFYAAGSANNAYAGNSRFGGVTAPTVAVDVTGAILASTTITATTGMAVGGATAGSGGVAFPAVAVSVADANTLDDYEEGTFTPVVRDAAAGNAATAATSIGRYTKIGNRVTYNVILLNVNTTGLTAGNQVFVTGLPFTSNSTANNLTPQTLILDSATPTTGAIGGMIFPSVTYAQLYNKLTTGISSLLVSQLTSTSADVWLSGSYEV